MQIESSTACFSNLLKYFYSDSICNSQEPDDLLEGISLANQYLLPSLKNAFERMLIKAKCIGMLKFYPYLTTWKTWKTFAMYYKQLICTLLLNSNTIA
jgi:hypothetical protein